MFGQAVRPLSTAQPFMETFSDDRRADARTDSTPRRTKLRLRELCDEVIDTRRLEAEGDPITSEDRAAAAELLPKIAPLLRT
jgi:hypothetical protein